MSSGLESLLKKSALVRWVTVLYAIGLGIYALPQFVIVARQFPEQLSREYKRAFAPAGAEDSSSLTRTPSSGHEAIPADVRAQIVTLERDLQQLRAQGSSERVDKLDASLAELRNTLFGDPARVVTLQRLDAEQQSLKARVDSVQTQIQWVLGIALTLALGVLTAVVGIVAKTAFERRT